MVTALSFFLPSSNEWVIFTVLDKIFLRFLSSYIRGMAGKFVYTISIFNRKRNPVKMIISGFAKIFHEQIDEILWKSDHHDIFYSLFRAPPWPRAGQGSTSQRRYLKFIAVSALYICNRLNRCFRFFPHRIPGYRFIFIIVFCCQMQICANCH